MLRVGRQPLIHDLKKLCLPFFQRIQLLFTTNSFFLLLIFFCVLLLPWLVLFLFCFPNVFQLGLCCKSCYPTLSQRNLAFDLRNFLFFSTFFFPSSIPVYSCAIVSGLFQIPRSTLSISLFFFSGIVTPLLTAARFINSFYFSSLLISRSSLSCLWPFICLINYPLFSPFLSQLPPHNYRFPFS